MNGHEEPVLSAGDTASRRPQNGKWDNLLDTQNKNRIDEKDLIERARRGETAAFETLVRSHENKLFSFALSITGGQDDAAHEILQEALIHAYRGLASFRGDCTFSCWLWRILKNDFERYKDREHSWELKRTGPDDPPETATEEEAIHEERLTHIRHLISLLSVDDQETLTLIEFQGLSFEEAAALIGISLDAFKSRLHRARKRLARSVEKNKNLFL